MRSVRRGIMRRSIVIRCSALNYDVVYVFSLVLVRVGRVRVGGGEYY